MKQLDLGRIRAKLQGIAEGFDGRVAQAGWFDSARYPDGTPVAYVATIQEYGDPGHSIPARSFVRPTVAAKTADWTKLLAQGVKAVAAGRYDAEQVLTGVGLQVAGDIGKELAGGTFQPLSPITVLLRKWRKEGRVITGKTVGEAAAAIAAGESIAGINADPLHETGYMQATLTSAVGDEP